MSPKATCVSENQNYGDKHKMLAWGCRKLRRRGRRILTVQGPLHTYLLPLFLKVDGELRSARALGTEVSR